MSQELAFWFIDLALRVKELLHVMPLTVACLFFFFLHVAWLRGRMTKSCFDLWKEYDTG